MGIPNFMILDLCNNSNILMVFLILKYAFSIVCTIIPIIVMYNTIAPLFKSVINPSDLTKQILPIVKSILAGLIVFFLPTLFNFVFTELLESRDPTISNCFANASVENVNRLKEKEAEERKKEQESKKSETSSELKKRLEEERKQNEIIKNQREELDKKKAEEEANNNNNNNSTNNNQSNSTTGNNAYGDLFVGDSRTVGLGSQVSMKSTDSVYATSGGAMSAFNTDVAKALNKINSDSSHRYNLILNYGVNNMSQDWVSAYKNVINQVNGKANILVVSVNPCNDNIAKYCRNSNIEVFNRKLESAFSSGYNNVKYCDTYTPFKNTPNYTNMIETKEGIHYTKQGGEFIYNKINQCLNSF